MYKILLIRPNGEQAYIYDQSLENMLPVIGPKLSFQINEAGSLQFTIGPTHHLYNSLKPFESYVRVLDDDDEIFYGRIIQRSEPRLTGQVSFQCEGALSFLLDSEVPPDERDSNGQQITRNLTAEQFFRWCIEKHNDEVNDPRRQFSVGTISVADKDKTETYSIGSYTQTKSAIESLLLNVYGGFIRVKKRHNNDNHVIDWIEKYENVDAQQIAIGINIEDLTNKIDANNMFTVIRPIGSNGSKDILLPERTIDLYNSSKMEKYGRIVKSISFKSADTEAKLRQYATDYKNKLDKDLFMDSSVKLVDMHYVDGTSPKIRLGNRYTNIDGFAGTELTVTSYDMDLEAPQNDSLTLQNDRSLNPDGTPEGNKRAKAGGSKRSHSRSSKAAEGQFFKYIHEEENFLKLETEKIEIHSQLLRTHSTTIETYGQTIYEQAGLIESVSSRVSRAEQILDDDSTILNDHTYSIQALQGTAVIQNSDFISQLSGKFDVLTDQTTGKQIVLLKSGSELSVEDTSGVRMTVADTLSTAYSKVVGVEEIVQTITGSALWTQKDNITGVVGEFEVKLYPDPDHPGRYLKKLVIKSGGGMRIEKDNVEYGIYMTDDGGNTVLTGGLLVDKINDGTTTTRLKGDRVLIGNNLNDDDLNSWAINAREGTGVFAKFLTVKKLTAQEIETMFADIGDAQIGYLDLSEGLAVNGLTVTEDIEAIGDIECVELRATDIKLGNAYMHVINITVSPDGQTLTIIKDDETITFEKASSTPVVTTKVSGSWSGGVLTVSADENGESTYVRSFTRGTMTWDANKKGVGVGVNAIWGSQQQYTESNVINVYVPTITSWNEGYDIAYGHVNFPTHAASGEVLSFNVSVPKQDRSGPETRTFTMIQGTPGPSGYVSVSLDGNVGVVGRIDVSNWYSSGWDDGYDTAYGYVHFPDQVPSGETLSFNVLVPKQDRTGQETKQFTVQKGAPSANGGYASVTLVGTGVVGRIDISNWWSAGWEAGYDQARGYVHFPDALASGETKDSGINILIPNAARTGQESRELTMSQGTPGNSGYASVTLVGTGVIGRIDISNWYKTGWNNGYDNAKGKVNFPDALASGVEKTSGINIRIPNDARNGQDTRELTMSKGTPSANGGYANVTLVGTGVIGRIDISNWWTKGWEAGYDNAKGKVNFPDALASGVEKTSGINILIPNDARNGQDTRELTMSKGTPGNSGYASVTLVGTGVIGRIDISNWYKQGVIDGRVGYTQGTFTLKTITLQGSSVSVYLEQSSGGTVYYQAGTAVTLYPKGSSETYYKGNGGQFTAIGAAERITPVKQGSGKTMISATLYKAGTKTTEYYNKGTNSFYARGDSETIQKLGSSVPVTPIGEKVYFVKHSRLQTPTDSWYEMFTTDPGGTRTIYYKAGTKVTYYKAGSTVTRYKGNGGKKTEQGTQATLTLQGAAADHPMEKTTEGVTGAIKYYEADTTITRYPAGSVYYARGDTVTVTPIGTGQTITPINSSTAKRLVSATKYNAGTVDSTHYYTKS